MPPVTLGSTKCTAAGAWFESVSVVTEVRTPTLRVEKPAPVM